MRIESAATVADGAAVIEGRHRRWRGKETLAVIEGRHRRWRGRERRHRRERRRKRGDHHCHRRRWCCCHCFHGSTNVVTYPSHLIYPLLHFPPSLLSFNTHSPFCMFFLKVSFFKPRYHFLILLLGPRNIKVSVFYHFHWILVSG
ncbi:hypothetical protein RIF29_38779 [Crotalaria pallida]|uniref:Uncharacterized protein n=1 Tax=Crotalaria pallida TaxID=3830 RepID=A0AAN9DZX5_CROPI